MPYIEIGHGFFYLLLFSFSLKIIFFLPFPAVEASLFFSVEGRGNIGPPRLHKCHLFFFLCVLVKGITPTLTLTKQRYSGDLAKSMSLCAEKGSKHAV